MREREREIIADASGRRRERRIGIGCYAQAEVDCLVFEEDGEEARAVEAVQPPVPPGFEQRET